MLPYDMRGLLKPFSLIDQVPSLIMQLNITHPSTPFITPIEPHGLAGTGSIQEFFLFGRRHQPSAHMPTTMSNFS